MLFVKRVLVLGLLFGDPHLSKLHTVLRVFMCVSGLRAADLTSNSVVGI